MSPNQIALCIIFLVFFCVAAWVKENWSFWKIRERNIIDSPDWKKYVAELDRKIAEKAMANPIPKYPKGTDVLIDWTKYKASGTGARVVLTTPPSDSAEYRTGAKSNKIKYEDIFNLDTQTIVWKEINEAMGELQKVADQLHIIQNYPNRGRRFLPSVNPLGDTGAFMNRFTVNQIFECDRSNRPYETTFRHKKGGSRG